MLGLFLTVKPQINAGNILTGIQPAGLFFSLDTEAEALGAAGGGVHLLMGLEITEERACWRPSVPSSLLPWALSLRP